MKTPRNLCVLQVIPTLNEGGAEQSCLDIGRAIVAAGGRAFVISSGGKMSQSFHDAGIEMICGNMASKNPFRIISNARVLMRLIRSKEFDIVHARSRAPAWSSYLACRAIRTPYVTTFHSQYNFSNRIKRFYNSVMVRGDAVIANSATTARHILENYEIDPAKLTVVNRGVDIHRFDRANADVSPEKLRAFRQKVMNDADACLITLPGRLTAWKGHRLFVAAVAKIFEKRADQKIECLFVGNLDETDSFVRKLRADIEAYGLADRFHFLGHSSEMPKVYASSDLVVSASIEPEGFGRVSAEAQAMEKVVVASNHGGSSEIIVTGETGFLFTNNDADDFCEKIEMFLTLKSEEVAEMGRRGRQRVIENYSLESMCDKTLKVYCDLLND